MAKKIKLEFTEAQFLALIDVTETINSSIGVGEPVYDKGQTKNVRLIYRAIKNSGYKVNFE